MQALISGEQCAKEKRKARAFSLAFRMLAAGGLILFVSLCLLTRTANARAMLRIMLISMTLLGWAEIILYTAGVRPSRARAQHMETLLSGPPEESEGILHCSGRPVRIPNSVWVRRVTLSEENRAGVAEEPPRITLNLDEELTDRLPPEGSRVRVRAVHGYITGVAVLSGAEAPERVPGRERGAGARSTLKRISGLIPAFVLWAMAVVILGGFVFNRITETDAAHKIVIFADCDVINGAELADRLERQLGEPIRMVKVHPFAYEAFGEGGIRQADLYILPASRAEQFRDMVTPLPEEMRYTEDPLMMRGEPCGIPLCGPAALDRTAAAYFGYDPAETYYLFFSAASLHLSGNAGAADNRAAEAAEALMAIR